MENLQTRLHIEVFFKKKLGQKKTKSTTVFSYIKVTVYCLVNTYDNDIVTNHLRAPYVYFTKHCTILG